MVCSQINAIHPKIVNKCNVEMGVATFVYKGNGVCIRKGRLMIRVYTGECDTQCPLTLGTAHELKHPVVFNDSPDSPFELDALVRWMTISDLHPTTRLRMPALYEVSALLIDSQAATQATAERIRRYLAIPGRYLTTAHSISVVDNMATMGLEQLEHMLRAYVKKADESQLVIKALQKDNEQLRKENTQLRRDNAQLRKDNAQLRKDNEDLKQRLTRWWPYLWANCWLPQA